MTPLVRIRDLCLHLNGRAILHHVDLELPRHGISVLLGRSGSGKTSFLRCLNRLHDCTRDSRMQGKIELLLDGTMQDISRLQGEEALSRLRRQVGMVFQTPNVLPASIGQNLLLPLQLAAGLDMDEARSRARRSLEDVGLWPEAGRACRLPFRRPAAAPLPGPHPGPGAADPPAGRAHGVPRSGQYPPHRGPAPAPVGALRHHPRLARDQPGPPSGGPSAAF